MSNRALLILIGLTTVGVVFLLALNLVPYLGVDSTPPHLIEQDIKGTSVVYKGTVYILNQDQQEELVNTMNVAIPYGRSDFNTVDYPKDAYFEIFFFNDPKTLILKPVGIVDENLVFKVPQWNKEGWIKDVTNGVLLRLLEEAHKNDQTIKNP